MARKLHRSVASRARGGWGRPSLPKAAAIALSVVLMLVFLAACSGENGEDNGPNTDGPEVGITEEGYPYKGSPDAPVKIIEYSDYLCGHCKGFALEKEPLIEEEYVASGKVQYIYHYYALGEAQVLLGEAAHCAADQGRFWEYHKVMFESQDRFGSIQTLEDLQGLLTEFAEGANLDVGEFEECWNSHKHQQTIIDAVLAAREEGVGGTPTISVGGELIVGNQDYNVFKTAIEEALAQAQ
jgi:protein-disulfide isomerase